MNNYLSEMCSGSEAVSYLRLIDFAHHSTLGLRVIKKKIAEVRAPCVSSGLKKKTKATIQGYLAHKKHSSWAGGGEPGGRLQGPLSEAPGPPSSSSL